MMMLVWSLTCSDAYDFYLGRVALQKTACPLSRVSTLPLLCSGAIHPLLIQLTHCNREVELYNTVYRCTISLTCKSDHVLLALDDCMTFEMVYRALLAARSNDIIPPPLGELRFIIVSDYPTLL